MITPSGNRVYGMAAEYPSAAALYEAAKQVRDAGYQTLGCPLAVSDSRHG